MKLATIPFPPGFAVSAAGRQTIGRREEQEDSFKLYPSDTNARPGTFLAVLSDGMGGMGDGAKASRNIVAQYVAAYPSYPPGELVQPVKQANRLLKDLKETKNLLPGAGGTLVGLEISKEGYRFISIGDSLLYLQRDQKVKRLNKSHNWEWEFARRVREGEMTQEEADADTTPRSALFAAVCGDVIPAADVSPVCACKPGDRFIVASDGILPLQQMEWEDLLNSEEFRGVPAEQACDALLDRLEALNMPKQDNATIVVVDILPLQTALPDNAAKWMWSSVSLQGDRLDQQDSEGAWVSPYASLAVVADGVGGHIGGAQASAKAVEMVESVWNEKMSRGVPPDMAAKLLQTAMQDAHDAVLEMGGGDPERSGKCAFVAAYLCDGEYTVVNAGDCRAYISSRGGWDLLSHDDSLLQALLDGGQVKPEDAANHPDQGILTQAIGGSKSPKAHVFHGSFEEYQSFLLCCDGLWNQLPDAEMRLWKCNPTKEAHDSTLADKAASAVKAKNGKSDNVSAVWLFSDKKPPLFKLRFEHLLISMAALCIALGAGFALVGAPFQDEGAGKQTPEQQTPEQPAPEQPATSEGSGQDNANGTEEDNQSHPCSNEENESASRQEDGAGTPEVYPERDRRGDSPPHGNGLFPHPPFRA